MSLKTRPIEIKDIKDIELLHNKFFSDFDFPDFSSLVNGFIIEDENDEIVIAGGVEVIAESLLVTNKDKSRIKIGKALVMAQGISSYTCWAAGIRELHAFVDDTDYARHLVKHGFEERTEKRVLVLKVK